MDDSQGVSRADGQILTLTISFRGHSEVVSLSSSSTLGELQETLYEKTNVPPALQKLLCKGKKIISGPEATLEQAGLKDKAKVQMLGSTVQQQLEDMMDAENERRRRDDILRARAEKRPPTVRMNELIRSNALLMHVYRYACRARHSFRLSPTNFTPSSPYPTSPHQRTRPLISTDSPPTPQYNMSCRSTASPSIR